MEDVGTRTNSMASAMLDFPEPFGPVMAVNPSWKGIRIFLPNDLKFSRFISVRYILFPTPADYRSLFRCQCPGSR